MNVAGPSRVPPSGRLASRGRVESTYEEDLLGLLSQLSLSEMEEMQAFFGHRGRAGAPLSDHDVAMNDLLEQARALAVFNQDRALALRIAAGDDAAEQTPAQRLGAVLRRPSENGRAIQRNGNQQVGQRAAPAARNNAAPVAPSQTWGGWFSSVVGRVFGAIPALDSRARRAEDGLTNTITPAPKPPTTNRPTGHDCVICQDPIRGAEVRAPCGHYYGIDCITDLFQSATRDETLFPPRCCRQNIPLAQVRPHLSHELLTTFQQKQVEFSTLKRVYCSSPTCSHFLGPLHEGIFASKVYTCAAPGCGKQTCGKCREQHSGDWTHTCRPDADATQVLELSRASGWARCPGCSQMIELHVGCFHMTCRCRTEFCYLCLARWKTCRCPQWDERRLLVAAEERVAAQLGVGRERGARRDAPAQRAGPVPVAVPANHAQAGGLGARPAVPAPRQAPALATPARPLVPAQPLAPTRPVPQVPVRSPAVETRYGQPTPTRTPTASTSAARPLTSILMTSREAVNDRVESWRSSTASASTASTSTARPPTSILVTSREATNNRVGNWRSSIASASTSTSTSASAPATKSKASTLLAALTSVKVSPESRSTPASGSASASTSAATVTPSVRARPKSTIHNRDADPMRQRLVREMMERLRHDHECDHGRWRYRDGGGVCQSCGHHLPLYLFRCQGCEMLACNRCRRNRL